MLLGVRLRGVTLSCHAYNQSCALLRRLHQRIRYLPFPEREFDSTRFQQQRPFFSFVKGLTKSNSDAEPEETEKQKQSIVGDDLETDQTEQTRETKHDRSIHPTDAVEKIIPQNSHSSVEVVEANESLRGLAETDADADAVNEDPLQLSMSNAALNQSSEDGSQASSGATESILPAANPSPEPLEVESVELNSMLSRREVDDATMNPPLLYQQDTPETKGSDVNGRVLDIKEAGVELPEYDKLGQTNTNMHSDTGSSIQSSSTVPHSAHAEGIKAETSDDRLQPDDRAAHAFPGTLAAYRAAEYTDMAPESCATGERSISAIDPTASQSPSVGADVHQVSVDDVRPSHNLSTSHIEQDSMQPNHYQGPTGTNPTVQDVQEVDPILLDSTGPIGEMSASLRADKTNQPTTTNSTVSSSPATARSESSQPSVRDSLVETDKPLFHSDFPAKPPSVVRSESSVTFNHPSGDFNIPPDQDFDLSDSRECLLLPSRRGQSSSHELRLEKNDLLLLYKLRADYLLDSTLGEGKRFLTTSKRLRYHTLKGNSSTRIRSACLYLQQNGIISCRKKAAMFFSDVVTDLDSIPDIELSPVATKMSDNPPTLTEASVSNRKSPEITEQHLPGVAEVATLPPQSDVALNAGLLQEHEYHSRDDEHEHQSRNDEHYQVSTVSAPSFELRVPHLEVTGSPADQRTSVPNADTIVIGDAQDNGRPGQTCQPTQTPHETADISPSISIFTVFACDASDPAAHIVSIKRIHVFYEKTLQNLKTAHSGSSSEPSSDYMSHINARLERTKLLLSQLKPTTSMQSLSIHSGIGEAIDPTDLIRLSQVLAQERNQLMLSPNLHAVASSFGDSLKKLSRKHISDPKRRVTILTYLHEIRGIFFPLPPLASKAERAFITAAGIAQDLLFIRYLYQMIGFLRRIESGKAVLKDTSEDLMMAVSSTSRIAETLLGLCSQSLRDSEFGLWNDSVNNIPNAQTQTHLAFVEHGFTVKLADFRALLESKKIGQVSVQLLMRKIDEMLPDVQQLQSLGPTTVESRQPISAKGVSQTAISTVMEDPPFTRSQTDPADNPIVDKVRGIDNGAFKPIADAPGTQPDIQVPSLPSLLPYPAQHYMMRDILDSFKQVLYEYGRMTCPELMDTMGWHFPESVPIAPFALIMSNEPVYSSKLPSNKALRFLNQLRANRTRELVELGSEWKLLQTLRHNYAHERPCLDVHEIQGTLRELETLAKVLKATHLVDKLKQYQSGVDDFVKRLEPLRQSLQESSRLQLKVIAEKKRQLEQEEREILANLPREARRQSVECAAHITERARNNLNSYVSHGVPQLNPAEVVVTATDLCSEQPASPTTEENAIPERISDNLSSLDATADYVSTIGEEQIETKNFGTLSDRQPASPNTEVDAALNAVPQRFGRFLEVQSAENTSTNKEDEQVKTKIFEALSDSDYAHSGDLPVEDMATSIQQTKNSEDNPRHRRRRVTARQVASSRSSVKKVHSGTSSKKKPAEGSSQRRQKSDPHHTVGKTQESRRVTAHRVASSRSIDKKVHSTASSTKRLAEGSSQRAQKSDPHHIAGTTEEAKSRPNVVRRTLGHGQRRVAPFVPDTIDDAINKWVAAGGG